MGQNGIRPMWEDAANSGGGKLSIRASKNISARYWEEIVSIK